FARERLGKGQRVDTSLLEACIAFIGENAARFFYDRKIPGRKDRTRIAQVYAVVDRDGRPFVVHLSSPTKFWEGLMRVVDRPALAADERFASRGGRIAHYEALQVALAEVFATDRRESWLRRLREADVPAAPLYDLAEVFDDPQVRHLGMRQEIGHPVQGTMPLVRGGVTFSETPTKIRAASPALGAHNDEILAPLRRDR